MASRSRITPKNFPSASRQPINLERHCALRDRGIESRVVARTICNSIPAEADETMPDSETQAAPTIVLGADHAGYKLKEAIKIYLIEQKFPVEDVGTWTDESVDYPDYARKVGERVSGSEKLGVLVCGTAIGMTIAANKVDGIRAAQAHDLFTARMAREHND